MVKIEISKDTIKVEGHANYAPHGQDIVCASVSILLETLEAGTNPKFLETVKKDEGYIEYKIYEPANKAKLLALVANMRLIIKGLKLLANDYPNNVEVVTK